MISKIQQDVESIPGKDNPPEFVNTHWQHIARMIIQVHVQTRYQDNSYHLAADQIEIFQDKYSSPLKILDSVSDMIDRGKTLGQIVAKLDPYAAGR